MTQKQKDDIETCLYFSICHKEHDNKDDGIRMFFEWSERGLHKDKIPVRLCENYFEHLYWAKVWRGRMINEIYEPSVLHDEKEFGFGRFITYAGIIESDTPQNVVEYIKKEIFGGKDKKVIDEVYCWQKERQYEK